MAEVNSGGTALVFSTFLGGASADFGYGMALDGAGNAYITGFTLSSNFPTTAGAFQTSFGGGGFYDAFVTKLAAGGSTLVYSTYLGGSGLDEGLGIAVDSSGNAYVTGNTQSANFPTTAGAFQGSLAGPVSAFVTKLNATGTALIDSTYLGGTSTTQAFGIAMDTSGNAYVAGGTASSDFPTTTGSYQTTYGGSGDAFVAKFSFSASSDTATTTTIATSQASVAYGTAVTFTATVSATSGTTAPSLGGVDFFDVTANKDLGNGTFGSSTGNASMWTLLTVAKTFNVTTGDVIKAIYAPGSGFSGSDSGASNNVTQVITAQPITVTATTNTKAYNGTPSAAGAPTIMGTVIGGDTPSFTETYDTQNAGTGKTLTPTGVVSDGNGGNNYAVTFVADTSGAITPLAITVTANPNTKGYDGTTSAAATPTLTGPVVNSDTPNFTESYDTRNAGIGKTLTADRRGQRRQRRQQLRGDIRSCHQRRHQGAVHYRDGGHEHQGLRRHHDGGGGTRPSRARWPAVTLANFTDAYDIKNAGTGETLTPAGIVNDGNGGNNYAVTFVTDTTGAIAARAITVTAATNTKDLRRHDESHRPRPPSRRARWR